MLTVDVQQVSLEVGVAELVALLILTILLGMLLYGVISEVGESVIEVAQIEQLARGSDVPFLVPIALQDSVVYSQQHVGPDIEFSLVVEIRGSYIVLEDEGFLLFLPLLGLNRCGHLLDLVRDSNPLSSVRELSWFHYPDLAFVVVVCFSELGKLFVVDRFNVVGLGDDIIKVFVDEGVVQLQREEQRFLVSKYSVAREVICHELLLSRFLSQDQLPKHIDPLTEFSLVRRQCFANVVPIMRVHQFQNSLILRIMIMASLPLTGRLGMEPFEYPNGRLLSFVDLLVLELAPVKVTILFRALFPPTPLLHYQVNQCAIIAHSYPILVRRRCLVVQVSIDSVGEVYQEKKLEVLVQLVLEHPRDIWVYSELLLLSNLSYQQRSSAIL